MIRIQKSVNTMAVNITITNQNGRSVVRGEVFPFARHFHSAQFAVCHHDGDREVDATVGGSGNSYPLNDAMRMIEAMKAAQYQASYYHSLIATLQNQREYRLTILDLMNGQHDDKLIDALLLTPKSIGMKNVEMVLSQLNKGKHLGLKASLRSSVVDGFFDCPETLLNAVIALCEAHPNFNVEDGDVAKAMDDLFYYLEQSGVFDKAA